MEWEQCKENIKPKREGRNISHINTTPKGTPMLAQIQEKQGAFEREIKDYEGEDEMEVWVKYVRYMEDAFPEGEYLSNVGTLQFRLIKRFQEDEKYKQDPRLLRIFLDLANHSVHATDVYAYCFYHNLVTTFSKFWTNWITCWIYKQRYDKALKICEKAIKIFKNTSTFRGMKIQILHAMDSSNTENMMENIEDLRKPGEELFKDYSQNQLPGPSSRSSSAKTQFSIFTDKNSQPSSLPSMSTNPLETRTRCKENAQPKKQRWKNVIAETESTVPVGKPFSIFEESSGSNQDKQKFEKNSTALKAKKVATSAETAPSSSKVPVLKGSSNLVSTVGYHKSKVYPLSGQVWSFEEIEAQRRFNARNNSLNSSTNSSKRSLDSDSESNDGKKCKRSVSESFEDSFGSKPLKSCLSTSKFGSNITEFNIENTIMSSTKKNICKEPENKDSVMAPNFGDALQLKQRSSLNLSVRSDSSLFTSDFKKPVEDSLRLASRKCESSLDDPDNKDDASQCELRDGELFGNDGPSDFTFKGLQTSIGLPEAKSHFAIYEDTVVREGRVDGPPKEPEIIKGAFSKKKLKLKSPPEPDDKPLFEIFSDSGKATPVKDQDDMLFGDNFGLDDINNFDGRPSDAFKIFKKTPEKSVEESYSLKRVHLTPCNNSTNNSYVPCTVEKMGVKLKSTDTQLIQKQVMNILNDCTTISEADENSPSSIKHSEERIPAQNKVSFAPLSSDSYTVPEESLNETELENEAPPKAPSTFTIFSDSEPAPDVSLTDKQPMVVPFSQEEFEENKIHLTPILEKSGESHCTSLDSNKTSNALSTTEVEKAEQTAKSDCYEKTLFMDHKNLLEGTRRSIEATATIPTQRSPLRKEEISFPVEQIPEIEEEEHYFLYPDKTNRDVPLDCTLLTRVPRTSLLPTEPVTDPYSQTMIERIVQSLDPPLFYRPSFNQHDFDLVPRREITLGALRVKNITLIGEGAFAKVYSGDCVDENTGCSEPRAFKIQSPPCPWEFYILSELLERMKEDDTSYHVRDMILPSHAVHVFNNSSVLMTSLFNEGSLLDMMNHYTANRRTVSNTVICTYTLDILRCVSAIHRAEIIHGDIKPDNLLLKDAENTMQSMSMKMTKSIVFVDFGRSIDMRILPPDSKFNVRSRTEMFECVEMQTNRPWTYQVDYYGMLSCIHLMIHSEYMKVYYDKHSEMWLPTKSPHRRVDQDLFGEMFKNLLNITDCDNIPSLDEYIVRFEECLKRIKTRERHTELKTHYQFMNQR